MRFLLLLLVTLFSTCTSVNGLQIERAETPEARAWGLMGRKELAKDQGMLFVFPEARYHRVWAFNCYLDLDVAFMDDSGIILQLETLKAYPDKMALLPPIQTVDDLKQLDYNDPIIRFFDKRSIKSTEKTRFFLEMPSGWFEENGLGEGDRFPLSLKTLSTSAA